MKRLRRSAIGFTLLELMVTIGILAILAVVAGSSFAKTSGWLDRIRLKSAARDMAMNFQFARMEAIKRNTFCTIVFNQTVGGVAYTYVIFTEPPTSQNLVYNSGVDAAPIKSMRIADYRNVILDTTQGGGDGILFPSNGSTPAFGFDQKGLPRRTGAGPPLEYGGGTVFLTDASGNKMSVVVNPTGQIRIQ